MGIASRSRRKPRRARRHSLDALEHAGQRLADLAELPAQLLELKIDHVEADGLQATQPPEVLLDLAEVVGRQRGLQPAALAGDLLRPALGLAATERLCPRLDVGPGVNEIAHVLVEAVLDQ